MPLTKEELSSLLGKNNAILIMSDEEQSSWKIKDRISFKCSCGNNAENQIRNIRKSGALCKKCMAKQKSQRISKSKTQEKNHIIDPLHKYCKNCNTTKHLRNFESKRKKGYTSICKQCRATAIKSNKKKRKRIQEKNKSLIDIKICLYCNEKKDQSVFLKANGLVSNYCSECREKRNNFEKNTKQKLKNTKPKEKEKKCKQCYTNRKKNCFSLDDEKCDTCVNINENAKEKKNRKRREKRLKTLEEKTGYNICIECKNIYKDKIENCSLCGSCRQYCNPCEMYISKKSFSKISQDKCKKCIQDKFKQTNMIKYGSSSYLNSEQHTKNRTKFTYEYLQSLLENDNAKFIKVIDIPLTRDSNVQFVCFCGNASIGNFRIFDKRHRAKCKECYQKMGYEKHLKTMLERYGVKNALHHPELFYKLQKTSFKWKQFVFPSGRIVEVQGYEHFAIRDLLKKYKEHDIKCGKHSKEVPRVKYIFEDKNRVYYPDIYIASMNKIVEVKSMFTYNKRLEQNLAKKKACIEKGYIFEFAIYNKKGVRLN